jgi:hypothetical protein
LPESFRRGAVHVVVIALIVAALAPQAVAANPPSAATERLLEAVEGSPESGFVVRGSTSQRSLLTYTSVSSASPLDTEQLLGGGYAAPPSVTMSAALERIPVPTVARPSGPATITGTASWYCCTMNWGDQAVVALPVALGGHYYPPPGGGTVVVCAERCATLPIGDACGCHWGETGQKVVDLSPAAWEAITDKDRHVYGVVTVTLHLN